jgi:hypothetical protein
VLILTQERCIVCAECTINSEIDLVAPNGILCDVGHVESRFGLFGDVGSVGAREVHGLCQTYHWLINCLDTSDGTPR